MDSRLRALCDLSVAESREYAGRHEYDGVVQDLSPDGVRRGLSALGGDPYPDRYDDALVAAKEAEARVLFGDLQLHRTNPLPHVTNLDVACYDRDYAPEADRSAARRRHLAAWPDAVDAALAALDAVPAPVAEGTLGSARGLAAGLDPDDAVHAAALAAQARLVAHLEAAARDGDPSARARRGPAGPAAVLVRGGRGGPGASCPPGRTASATGCGRCWTRPAAGSPPAGRRRSSSPSCCATTRTPTASSRRRRH